MGNVGFKIADNSKMYGISKYSPFNGYEPRLGGWYANSDKMQKITLNELNNWFNK